MRMRQRNPLGSKSTTGECVSALLSGGYGAEGIQVLTRGECISDLHHSLIRESTGAHMNKIQGRGKYAENKKEGCKKN